jgi:hypothetical protein
MFTVEVPARRLLTAQKHLALARLVVRTPASTFPAPDVRKTASGRWESRLSRSFETLHGGLRPPTALSFDDQFIVVAARAPDPSIK